MGVTAQAPATRRADNDVTRPSAASATKRSRAGAESARYGVLRRLGPALKHDMVVNLQAIAMMAEVLNAKLERGSPSPAEFQATISKLNRLAREAVANCLKVAAWIEPQEDEAVLLSQGIADGLALLASNFNFRGIVVEKELADAPFQVSSVLLRNLLVATLITLTDAAGGPCIVHVSSEIAGPLAEVTVRTSPRTDDTDAIPFEPSYRHLEWADVQSLATAEGVELVREADRIVMRIPRVIPNAPLQIAPV